MSITLFDNSIDTETDALKKSINNKFGRFTLRGVETLSLKEIYSDNAQSYVICDIQGKSCF